MTQRCKRNKLTAHLPEPEYCTDNAAMVASAAYFNYQRGNVADLTLDAVPNLALVGENLV
jgi:N6-L-threonylcarbamoyladenine synthase